jgi:ribosomal protein S18 acetylase RimI-like enzyme
LPPSSAAAIASRGATKSRPRSADPLYGLPDSIRKATRAEIEPLSASLAAAFRDDPAWSHLLPDAASRERRLRAFFRSELTEVALPHDLIYTNDDLSGAAIWAPPDRWRVSIRATLRETPAMVRVFGGRLGLAMRSRMRIESKHPSRPGHFYLAIVGVEPGSQGRGLGSRLMFPILSEADAGGVAAYLEASTPRSRLLYERHGFTVQEEIRLPRRGPAIWRMWREPFGAEK